MENYNKILKLFSPTERKTASATQFSRRFHEHLEEPEDFRSREGTCCTRNWPTAGDDDGHIEHVLVLKESARIFLDSARMKRRIAYWEFFLSFKVLIFFKTS